MFRRERHLCPELQALLSPGRIERRAPPDVRARALAGARAIVAARGKIAPVTVLRFPARRIAKRRFPIWLPAAASIAIAAVAIAALHREPPPKPLIAPSRTARSPVLVLDQHLGPKPTDRPQPTLQPEATPGAANTARTGSVSGTLQRGDGPALSAELNLLSQAHAAYTRSDLPRALALIAEHARRFPNGHLAEEREALRVRSLMRSGHTDESHRAASAFTLRFPRSVLMAHVEGSERPK